MEKIGAQELWRIQKRGFVMEKIETREFGKAIEGIVRRQMECEGERNGQDKRREG